MVNQSPTSVAQLLGRNCKRIRTDLGLTQDDLARHSRDVGLRWTASKVSDFEAGRSAPAFTTVIALVMALQRAANDPAIVLPDLLKAPDGAWIHLTDELDVSSPLLTAICTGDLNRRDIRSRPRLRSVSSSVIPAYIEGDADGLLSRFGLAENRLAQRLNISREMLAAISYSLWQRTFSEERDSRAGAGSSPQKRGQVARDLQAQIESKLLN